MKRRGMSLVEVIMVAAIVMSLAAIAWLLIAPAAKRRGVQATLTSDLHQIAMSIRMYMADTDDAWPATLECVKAVYPSTPIKPPVAKDQFPECGGGRATYDYTRNYGYMQGERAYDAEFPFDVNRNAIVKADFFCWIPGTKEQVMVFGDGVKQWSIQPVRRSLGVRLDGSVGWFRPWEDWQEEFAAKRRSH